jgi:hypothetical protein
MVLAWCLCLPVVAEDDAVDRTFSPTNGGWNAHAKFSLPDPTTVRWGLEATSQAQAASVGFSSHTSVGQPALVTSYQVGQPRQVGAPQASNTGGASGPAGLVGPRIGCTRDDWAYLPQDATSGLPCRGAPAPAGPGPAIVAQRTVVQGPSYTVTDGQSRDPRVWADRLEGEIGLPPVQLAMNPALGLVNVPTWFWVEGYQGEVLSKGQTVALESQVCHTETVTQTDDAGQTASQSRNVCETHVDYLTVEVRLFPTAYRWSFGDGAQQQLGCAGEPGACLEGLGLAYRDPRHPSPIAHPYQRSSLRVGGAYPVGLAIDFGAEYRFQLNGAPLSAWAALPPRQGRWATTHPVQEAQAVLTRP